jgi:hypothetical protein
LNGLCCAKSASVVDRLPFQRLAAEKRVHYQRFQDAQSRVVSLLLDRNEEKPSTEA